MVPTARFSMVNLLFHLDFCFLKLALVYPSLTSHHCVVKDDLELEVLLFPRLSAGITDLCTGASCVEADGTWGSWKLGRYSPN